MNLKELPKLWGRYQTWLKENGINVDNIQQKMPEIIQKIKTDPEKMKELKSVLSNPQVKKITKKMGIDDNQFNQMKNLLDDNIPQSTNSSVSAANFSRPRIGNLTQEQMDLIKKVRGKP